MIAEARSRELETTAMRSWRALGTSVHVLVSDESSADAAASAVHNVVEQVDQTYSRFRDDSELARVNARAGRAIRVSPLLGRVIETALHAARLTEGAVDPTVGRAIRSLGYDRDFPLLPPDGAPIVLRIGRIPGWQVVSFDPYSRTVRVPPGVELDFGSTGKALAADLAAAAALHVVGSGGVLVSLGGDIATAGNAPFGGWRVLVAEDSETPPDAAGEVVAIRDGGLATSSTRVRRWTRGGVSLHHIVSPETGLPASGPWRTVTVAAASCVDANVAATATIVRGAEGRAWLERNGLPARLVAKHGSIEAIAGWPQPAGAAS